MKHLQVQLLISEFPNKWYNIISDLPEELIAMNISGHGFLDMRFYSKVNEMVM